MSVLARKRVESWAQEKPSFEIIDKAVAKQGWKIVFLTRLSPVFPFNFQNYAYGLTGVSFWHYVLASWIGMIPGTIMQLRFDYAWPFATDRVVSLKGKFHFTLGSIF